MLAVCMNIISLFLCVRFSCNFIFRRAHIGQMPTFSTIITLSLMAVPSPLEENVLLRLTSTMVIAPGGVSGLPHVYKQFQCFPLYFPK